ncbi:hypothetical protein HK104_005552 [Borealophlyctis nickersoniae]|nr:hypothetical protein HK104_005552 [Borealophlyctis nickersoniae]
MDGDDIDVDSENGEGEGPQDQFAEVESDVSGPRLLVRLYVVPQDVDGRRHIPALPEGKRAKCKAFMDALLRGIDPRPEAWRAEAECKQIGLFSRKTFSKGLADIYAEMPSPAPFLFTDERADPADRMLLNECLTMSAPKGMKSTLFNYQKKTLWKMVQRELFPQLVPAPDLLECQTANGQRSYWLETMTGRLYNRPTYYTDGQGGVICEDMGTGKTCICIALILHTRHQISCPPVDCPVLVRVNPQYLPVESSEDINAYPVPSLKELAAATIRVRRLPIRHLESEGLSEELYNLLDTSPPYYIKYPPQSYRARRCHATQPSGMKVYLSSTTLIVVPDTLVNQWVAELNKHVDGPINYLRITKADDVIPPATELIRYDIVLISSPQFGQEQSRGGLDFQGFDALGYRSPLLQVRWLRLIVDEGHTMAKRGESSSQVGLAARLECDRRWVCTGTPMPNILDKNVEEDKVDLEKLGMLLKEFLKVEPYASGDAFRSFISRPFLQKQSHGYEKLRNLMERVMVRNRQEDIERDVILPPLHTKIVRLPFNPHQCLVQNCILSFIAANAVLSERKDQDYFFHRSNRKSLATVVGNLHMSSFWFSGPELLSSIHHAINNVREGLNAAEERGYSEEDIETLTRCDAVLQEAYDEKWFEWLVEGVEVAYLVEGMPKKWDGRWRGGDDRGAWKWVDREKGIGIGHGRFFEDARAKAAWHQYREAQKKRLEAENDAAERAGTAAGDAGADPAKSTSEPTVGSASTADVPTAGSVSQSVKPKHTSTSMKKEYEGLPRPKKLAKAQIFATTSSKLTYLAEQLIKYAPTDKIIVYAQHDNEIYYIEELLRLAQIRYLLFHKGMAVKVRAQNITTFNTTESVRVIVMLAQIASWGIDLSSASRVYFVSPIWESSMERQAIKRAHRMGCKRAVYVETLVIQGSFEEEIVVRRKELGETAHKRVVNMTDDGKMASILRSARFIDHTQPSSVPVATSSASSTSAPSKADFLSSFPRIQLPIPVLPQRLFLPHKHDEAADAGLAFDGKDGDDYLSPNGQKRVYSGPSPLLKTRSEVALTPKRRRESDPGLRPSKKRREEGTPPPLESPARVKIRLLFEGGSPSSSASSSTPATPERDRIGDTVRGSSSSSSGPNGTRGVSGDPSDVAAKRVEFSKLITSPTGERIRFVVRGGGPSKSTDAGENTDDRPENARPKKRVRFADN